MFPNPSGRFDGLVAGRRYLIYGDPAVAETTAAASSSSSASTEPILGLTPAYAGSSVSGRRYSSWAAFKSVAPRFALSRKATPLREIKKSEDYRLVEAGQPPPAGRDQIIDIHTNCRRRSIGWCFYRSGENPIRTSNS